MEKEKRVEVYVPKGYVSEEPNLMVGVNGVNYLLPRGKASLVPKCVAEELDRSRKAQTELDRKMDAMLAGD